jgi:hypothetical protein
VSRRSKIDSRRADAKRRRHAEKENDVSRRPEEDCSSATSAVGEGQGCQELVQSYWSGCSGTDKVGSPVHCAGVCRQSSRWCSEPQVSDIADHTSPIPRLSPCSSSEGRTPRKETGSVFGAAGCCSTSTAVRCELSRLRLWESLLPSFV